MTRDVLTVERLIKDLSMIDGNAEVQMGIRHIEMTVPIGGLMTGSFKDEPVAILVVDPFKVKAAFDYASKADMALVERELAEIQDATIVDVDGQKLN